MIRGTWWSILSSGAPKVESAGISLERLGRVTQGKVRPKKTLASITWSLVMK